MNAIYIWQQTDWPNFTWDDAKLSYKLGKVRGLQGKLVGKMSALGFDLKNSAILDTLTADITKSSEIEGEILNSDQVRSSVARHLGIETEGLPEADRYVDGVVQLMMDATQNYMKPLTDERLFNWHAALFPTGRSGMYKITVADWRQGVEPMQVISGAMGKEKVHYQAPDSDNIPFQMKLFLDWVNDDQKIDPVLKAAIAHLWFVTIHPFDDGNGRIARTIMDLFLARADEMPHRFYSMSAEIRKQRKGYYEILEKTQKGGVDITGWLEWFLDCLEAALVNTEKSISTVLQKAAFWDRYRLVSMNERQIKMVNLLWDGFDGKLTSSKWGKITKCSADTALRDIQDLMTKGVLHKTDEGGRSTNYELVM
ncbi:Fic family protein [Parabacteroides sp. BX2]|uniref:Fic family protein n=1 Tax=Parabacteroides segnis TaxID=2763058 RepID=A0ABR7E6T8_9BACT|nr:MULTISPECIES: Fic family protein [Parabacteroides]MBC5644908.1 Fic family protein [Parabacteroides segnis]MCM0712615.1 Fic family protein [Parabacteroides sp. TA-V-105]